MRTAMGLAGAASRSAAVACSSSGPPAASRIRIYPELKEHSHWIERFMLETLGAYSQNTTDPENTERTRLAINSQYSDVALQPVVWNTRLEAISRTNQPDYTYFLTSRLFRDRELSEHPTLIVSHGYFLRRSVLGRYATPVGPFG